MNLSESSELTFFCFDAIICVNFRHETLCEDESHPNRLKPQADIEKKSRLIRKICDLNTDSENTF